MPSVEKVEFQRNDVPFTDWRKAVTQFTKGLYHTINIRTNGMSGYYNLPSRGRDASHSAHEPIPESHQRNL